MKAFVEKIWPSIVPLLVKHAGMDHSEAFYSSVKRIWPGCFIYPDWAHFAREKKAQHANMIEDGDLRRTWKACLDTMHSCTTKRQFMQVGQFLLDTVRAVGDESSIHAADTVEKMYMNDKWCCWFVGSSGVEEICPNTQQHENYNKHKGSKLVGTRKRLDWLFEFGFPRPLFLDSMESKDVPIHITVADGHRKAEHMINARAILDRHEAGSVQFIKKNVGGETIYYINGGGSTTL